MRDSLRDGGAATRSVRSRMPPTILVCEAQVPFVQGGAEFHVTELVRHLREHGYPTELVRVPFKWYPKR